MDTPSNKPAKRFRIKWRWIIPLLVLLPFLTQIPSCVMANAAKYGRVVDASTGKGIPDALVIHATRFNPGAAFYGGDPLTRAMVRTDENGNYRIPSAWFTWPASIPFRLFVNEAHTTFLITAFKPGYAFLSDDKAWAEYDQFGWPHYRPQSSAFQPHALWLGLFAKVDDLQLKPVQLTTKQAAVYYEGIFAVGLGGGPEVSDPADDEIFKRRAYDFLLPKICNEPPGTRIDSIGVGALDVFVADREFFLNTIRKAEPNGFQDREELPVLEDEHKRYQFDTLNVCKAMQARGSVK